MPRIYTSPPLVEAIASFHFRSDNEWDWTIPGLLYNKIGEDYPEKEQEQTVQFQFDGDMSTPPKITGTPSKLKFKNEAGSKLIQVGPTMLTYNALGEGYTHWEDFQREFERVLRCYSEVNPDAVIERVGLRYINDVLIPWDEEGGLDLTEHFHVGVELPKISESIYNPVNIFMKSTISFDESDVSLSISFGNVHGEIEDGVAFRLDLDAFAKLQTSSPEDFSLDSVMKWMELAHEHVEVIFDASFTERVHTEIFGGDGSGEAPLVS